MLKEDCQAFGLIVSKSISNAEAFSHCITSYPLSVATPDGEMRQSDMASFRNYLKDVAGASSKLVPEKAAWFVDGVAANRSLKAKDTFQEWIDTLLRFISPPGVGEATVTGMINDTYSMYSTKAGTRKKRGEGSRTHVEGVKQHMPSGMKWQEFLGNNDNKEDLIDLIFEYIQKLSRNKKLNRPLVFSRGEETFRISDGNSELIHRSNQEEADTRLVLQAYLEKGDVVIACKDTDVLVLMVWAYTFYNVSKKWYTGKDDEDYVTTRIRLYQNLKVKSSMTIPPDPDSVVQVIKRSHHQVYQWLRCCSPWVDTLSFEDNGWIVEEEDSQPVVKPVWFTGTQLPPSAQKKNTKKAVIATAGNLADDDLTDPEDVQPPKRKRQKRLFKKEREGTVIPTSEEAQEQETVGSVVVSLQNTDHDEDRESEGGSEAVGDTSMDADWEKWEDCDFLTTDNDSADKWLP